MNGKHFEGNTRFEQDLRAVLQDMAPTDAPKALRDAVAAVPRTHPVPAARPSPLARARLAIFAPLAAVIVLGVVGLVVLLGGGFGGNVAAPSPSASPITSWTTLTYEAALPASKTPPISDSILPSLAVAEARLRSARIPFASQATVSTFSVTVPTNLEATAAGILGTTGDLAFVPMGSKAAAAGDTIDLTAHPPLFGSGGVASAAAGTDQTGQATLDMTLTPSAKTAFATYTSGHIGEYFAIVLDGKVLTAPVIQSGIPDGQVQISGSGTGGFDPAMQTTLIAILTSGPLPQPITQLSSESASAPADPWTPGPIVAPTPSSTAVAVVPPMAVTSELPVLSGTPASVVAPFHEITVATLSGSALDAPRVTAWAHGYLGFGTAAA
jgi:hypothetical protein